MSILPAELHDLAQFFMYAVAGAWGIARIRSDVKDEIHGLRMEVKGITTQLVGVDGQNGMRSELRELKAGLHDISSAHRMVEHRVTVIEESRE